MAMSLIELLKRIFSTATDEFEIAVQKVENNRNPKDQLILLKRDFEQRKAQFEQDTKEVIINRNRLEDQLNEVKREARNARVEYRNLLGLDEDDKPVLASVPEYIKNKAGKYIYDENGQAQCKYVPKYADPGMRMVRTWSGWKQEEITEDDQLQAQMYIEQAEGYDVAIANLQAAFDQADQQVKYCEDNLKKMGFVSKMYESKLKLIQTQICAANAAKSLVRIGTFDVDMNKSIAQIQDKVKEISWSTSADLRIAQIKRESTPSCGQIGMSMGSASGRSAELIRIAMGNKK